MSSAVRATNSLGHQKKIEHIFRPKTIEVLSSVRAKIIPYYPVFQIAHLAQLYSKLKGSKVQIWLKEFKIRLYMIKNTRVKQN